MKRVFFSQKIPRCLFGLCLSVVMLPLYGDEEAVKGMRVECNAYHMSYSTAANGEERVRKMESLFPSKFIMRPYVSKGDLHTGSVEILDRSGVLLSSLDSFASWESGRGLGLSVTFGNASEYHVAIMYSSMSGHLFLKKQPSIALEDCVASYIEVDTIGELSLEKSEKPYINLDRYEAVQ